MLAGMAPKVLADPIGVVVDIVAGFDSALDRTAIEDAVTGVAGGRAKRRRLAQALLDRPAVLTDGRSPAPRVVADLLLALREAGAVSISPPVCVECGKQLRTFHRRGEDWYCAVCGPRPRRCASCGQERIVATLDRRGQPRCSQCPEPDDRDPLVVLTEVISTLEPALPADAVTAAIHRVFSKDGNLRHLAWAVEDRPDLLTGQGAHAPTPGVLRLIDELCDAGAQTIRRPACPRCQRIIRLHRRIGGQWLCRNCVAKSRAQRCSRCGAAREAAARDEQRRPLCASCLVTDPVNHETCAGCGRNRRVAARTAGGPVCQRCRPWKTLICDICGRTAPCAVSKATGKPWCRTCTHRWARCVRCDDVAPVRGGTRDAPLCSACTCPDAGFWRSCPTCGQAGRIRPGECARCNLRQRLRDLLGDDRGEIRPHLRALHQALVDADRPSTVAAWLNRSTAPAILRDLEAAKRPLTHDTLDELPAGKPVEHLRSILVAVGTLPPRDEQMTRLERWITRVIAERPDPDQQQLLHRYAVWHVLRRLRGRVGGANTTYGQVVAARRYINAAIALLDWLTTRGLTLTTARQGDLEAWLASPEATSRADAGNFVRWAKKQKLTPLSFPAVRWGGPSGLIDTETRWEQARWLLHDDTLKPEDRVAGLLILLYAQTAAAISRLTLDHAETSDNEVRLRLGLQPVVLPEPVDALVRQLVATRRGHAALGVRGTSPWLFPGGRPGHPISAFRLAERLRQLGIQAGPSRSTALFQLATELPAAVLARTLGVHIAVAAAWQRASSGDWTNYAAELSKRTGR